MTKKYCLIEDTCENIARLQAQYDKVVQQNRDLQQELNYNKSCVVYMAKLLVKLIEK